MGISLGHFGVPQCHQHAVSVEFLIPAFCDQCRIEEIPTADLKGEMGSKFCAQGGGHTVNGALSVHVKPWVGQETVPFVIHHNVGAVIPCPVAAVRISGDHNLLNIHIFLCQCLFAAFHTRRIRAVHVHGHALRLLHHDLDQLCKCFVQTVSFNALRHCRPSQDHIFLWLKFSRYAKITVIQSSVF